MKLLPRRILFGALAGGLALFGAMALAEVVLRALPPQPVPGALFYQDASRAEADYAAAKAAGLIEAVPQSPRPRERFAPGAHFYICYRNQDAMRKPWLDEQGCVEVRINRWGLRERDDDAFGPQKPPGQQRIVCIGDSFTFGWGIPAEQNWVRMLEDALRKDLGDVRTINCGAAGAIVPDEYWWGLRDRFGAFQPDAVLVTLCLNDLIPSSGLCLALPPRQPTGFRLLDGLYGLTQRGPLDLDPAVDWSSLLLQLPEKQGLASGLLDGDKPVAAMWASGGTQEALQRMQDWCKQRNVRFLVCLWPFLQGLSPGATYPFRGIHDRVAAFCAGAGIPFLDLLPSLQGHHDEELWVTPADYHPNPQAQRLALPAIEAFVRQHGR